jgi:carbonic anhydrase
MATDVRHWLATVACAAVVGCGAPDSPEAPEEVAHHDETHGEVHWGYEGAEGPEHWADLSPEFSVCASGREQSPIDLSGATSVSGEQFDRLVGEVVVSADQRAEVLDLINNTHTIQVTPGVDAAIVIDGVRFGIAQYHFHAPSEHALDGKRYPLEAHFVTSNADGELAVLGVVYEVGEAAPEFDVIVSNLPSGAGEERHLEKLALHAEKLRPMQKTFYAYRGSLTTPPCSEGVRWFVFAEPEQLSSEQLDAIAALLPDNARPLQPLNERELLLVTSEE